MASFWYVGPIGKSKVISKVMNNQKSVKQTCTLLGPQLHGGIGNEFFVTPSGFSNPANAIHHKKN